MAAARGPRPDPRLALALLAVATAAVYLPALGAPFVLDDFPSIVDNALIHRWRGFAALHAFAPMRWITYLTFVLDQRLGGLDPRGYHAVNILIHILAALAVYGLARALLRTPRLEGAVTPEARTTLPLLAAALFALHPLHTEAVTYVVQRLTSLVALFYIATLAAWIEARLATTTTARTAWGAGCAALALLALFSKETAATLPLAILLVEIVGFGPGRKRLLVLSGAMALVLAAAFVVAVVSYRLPLFSRRAIGGLASQTAEFGHLASLGVQARVLWIYFRLFLWPAGLHLDHAALPAAAAWGVASWLALMGHLALIGLALAALRRFPLFSFGVLFVYLAHAVSSLVPVHEQLFEHRAYLPDVGWCLIAAWLLTVPAPRLIGRRGSAATLAAIVLTLLGVATLRRNLVWRDPVAFWQDDVRRAPDKARAWGNLGRSLIEADRPAEGVRALEESMRLDREASQDLNPLDIANLAVGLHALHRDSEALGWIDRTLARPLPPPLRATLLLDRGNIHFDAGRLAAAESAYRGALALNPDDLSARENLASVAAQSGHLDRAESLYIEVLRIDPSDRDTRANLAQVRARRLLDRAEAAGRSGRWAVADSCYRAAAQALEQVLAIDPGDSSAALNLRRVKGLEHRAPPP
jgi:tetratricopeptide (TPR) repeat protein